MMVEGKVGTVLCGSGHVMWLSFDMSLPALPAVCCTIDEFVLVEASMLCRLWFELAW